MKPLMAIPSPPSHLRIYYQLTQFSSTFFTELKFKWLLLLLQRGLHRPQFGAATTTNQPESRERELVTTAPPPTGSPGSLYSALL